MPHDLVSSLASLESTVGDALLARDVAGACRPADTGDVLRAAQRMLASRLRGSDPLSSPKVVKDFLRVRLGMLPHQVFAVVHLDARHHVIHYVEMFRGTLNQTSVYPREVVKDALMRNSAALIFVHNHPSEAVEPSQADRLLTQALKSALVLVGIAVLDHMIVAGEAISSMAERGLL